MVLWARPAKFISVYNPQIRYTSNLVYQPVIGSWIFFWYIGWKQTKREYHSIEVCFIQTCVALNGVLLFLKSCSYFKFPNKTANAPRQGRPHLLSLWAPLRMCMLSLQDDTKCWLLLEEFPAVPAKMVTSVTLSTGYHDDGMISYVNLPGPQVHRYLVKPYSGSICRGFWMRLTFESTEWVKQTALSKWVGFVKSVEELNRTRRLSKWEVLLPDCLELGQQSFFLPLGLNWNIRSSSVSSLVAFGLELRASLVLRPLNSAGNYTISIPGSLACGQQILGLLSFHNHVNQFLLINLFIHTHNLKPVLL